MNNVHVTKILLVFLIFNLLIVGSYLYVSVETLYLSQPYSVASLVVAICYIYVCKIRLDCWYFWFLGFYILLFNLGLIFGVIISGFGANFLSFQSTFSNFVSEESASLSYIVTSIALLFLVLFYPIMCDVRKTFDRKFNTKYYQMGLILVVVSAPLVGYNLLHQLYIISQNGYVFLYTKAYQDLASGLPMIGLFTNLNRIGFLLLFASLPSIQRINWIMAAFIFFAVLDALKGSRGLIILPLAWCVYYKARFYNVDMLSGARKYVFGVAAFMMVFLAQMIRSSVDMSSSVLTNFLVFSISKAQYHVALFIENLDGFSDHGPFFFAPLLFPINYLRYGESIVGQSLMSADIRSDLNHVMSSTLNLSAYLDGAGMGSSLVSEAYQYGIFAMIVMLSIFLLVYKYLFKLSEKRRSLFILQPLLFMHVAFSARDTGFPNPWIYIKFAIMIFCIFTVYGFLQKTIGNRELKSVCNRPVTS